MALLRKRTRRLLGLLVALLASCLLAEIALLHALSGADELARGRARWQARPFARYRLVTELFGGMRACRQDVEILNERVVQVFENTCPRSAVTVTNLFLEIDRFELIVGGRCGPNGCECDGSIEVDASFDPALGYPKAFHVRSRPAERWRYLSYWRRLASGAACPRAGFDGPAVEVVALTPLP
jgi:hypothetical protein